LYGQGITRGRILSTIFDNPEGIEEGVIRDIMREEYGIRESKGIKKHLQELSKVCLVQKVPPRSGRSNIWKPSGLNIDMFCGYMEIVSQRRVGVSFLLKVRSRLYSRDDRTRTGRIV